MIIPFNSVINRKPVTNPMWLMYLPLVGMPAQKNRYIYKINIYFSIGN